MCLFYGFLGNAAAYWLPNFIKVAVIEHKTMIKNEKNYLCAVHLKRFG